MKKIYLLVGLLSILFVVGCAKEPPIMPAIKYNKPINFQVKNKAYLYWIEGQHLSAILYHNRNNRLVPVLTDYLSMQKEEPKVNTYPLYGKAEQVIFVTSLRDILVNNQIFSAVDIITNPKKIADTFPLININFKSTKHSIDKITIVVDLEIVYAKSHFKRTYLVESDPKNQSTILQQISVSEKLVDKIILALKEWQAIIKQNGIK